ncbi:MAG: tetratricopeptide repeat protein, partial [Deltaproteobacteria bacterium]|nr:tetratricopeptide repeat protein [Deltaproteobacteria bacterium]
MDYFAVRMQLVTISSRLKGLKRVNLISKQTRKPPGLIRYTAFMLAMGALLAVSGCSRGLIGGRPVARTSPVCDKAADDAMRRRDFQAGVILHERFLVDHPDNGLALYHLGFAYGQLGDHVNEVAYYEKAISAGFKDEDILFNLGMAYGELGQMNKAVDAFQEALKISPGSADNHFGLALVYQSAAADE